MKTSKDEARIIKKLLKFLNNNFVNNNKKLGCVLKNSVKNTKKSLIITFLKFHIRGGKRKLSERNRVLKKIIKLAHNDANFKTSSINDIIEQFQNRLKQINVANQAKAKEKKRNEKNESLTDVEIIEEETTIPKVDGTRKSRRKQSLKPADIRKSIEILDGNNWLQNESNSSNDIQIINLDQDEKTIEKSVVELNENVQSPVNTSDKYSKQEEPITENAVSPKKSTFIDSLLSKIRTSKTNQSPDNESSLPYILSKKANLSSLNIFSNQLSTDRDETSSNSSQSEFRGFTEADANSNILSSLLDASDKENNKSVFESEKLNEFLKENSLENCSKVAIPVKTKYKLDEAMISSGSEIPLLNCPKQFIKKKARTVAEKRQILESRKDIKFLMAETESTVYWELKRRSKENSKSNYELIRKVLAQDIPFRRDIWRTATWLATDKGKFYFQTINTHDNITIKLCGGIGNFVQKNIPVEWSSKMEMKNSCLKSCEILKEYPDVSFSQLQKYKFLRPKPTKCNTLSKTKQLLSNYQCKLRSGPLSSKVRSQENDDIILGSLDIFKMPRIELEVLPKLKQTFPPPIHSYLKLIQPTDFITEEWAKFACSVVVQNRKQINIAQKDDTFAFEIPYSDNQNQLLVRRLKDKHFNIKNKNEIKSLGVPLKFTKNVNKKDHLEVEIGNYLSDMINSVAINICQNEFIKEDPDLNYLKKVDNIVVAAKEKNINNFQNKNVNMNSSKIRVLKELKRLNATFIETQTKTNDVCENEHCKLGCVCLDIRQIVPIHCRREKCMFACSCKRESLPNRSVIVEDGLSEMEMKILRDKATDGLAKAEKEFSSTVVLTNDNTILIHNTQVDSKRLRKRSRVLRECSDSIDEPEKKIVKISEEKNVTATENVLSQMTHVNVSLNRISGIDNLIPWCMVHCLYKCFCNGQSITGKVFGFNEKEITNVEPAPQSTVRMRAYYTFAKENSETDAVIDVVDYGAARLYEVDTKKYIKINKARRSKIINTIIKKEKNSAGLHNLLRKRIVECILKCRPKQTQEIENKTIEHSVEVPLTPVTPAKSVIEISDDEDSTPETTMEGETSALIFENQAKKIEQSTPNPSNEISKDDSSFAASLDNSKQEASDSVVTTLDPNVIMPTDSMFKVPNKIPIHLNETPKRKNKDQVSRLNIIVTKAMANICDIQKNNSKHIQCPKLKCLSNLRWEYLLQAFEENLAYIWQIRYLEKNRENILIALTKASTVPKIPNIISCVNVKRALPSSLTFLARMLQMRVRNERTKTLAVLLFGQAKFWSIIGFIHSETDYIENGVFVRPTPVTHPKLARKINRLHHCLIEKFGQDAEAAAKPNQTTEMEEMQTVKKVHTNIEMENINLKETKTIAVPLPLIQEHRWFMLVITEDFSDIFIPSWKSFLKYERITATHEIAKKTQKTVRILSNKKNDAYPNVYITPTESNKIFFGPYCPNQPLEMILCQELDGRMLLREEYEKLLKIKRTTRTSGCWLYMKGDKIIFSLTNSIELDAKDIQMKSVSEQSIIIDDDEDIVNQRYQELCNTLYKINKRTSDGPLDESLIVIKKPAYINANDPLLVTDITSPPPLTYISKFHNHLKSSLNLKENTIKNHNNNIFVPTGTNNTQTATMTNTGQIESISTNTSGITGIKSGTSLLKIQHPNPKINLDKTSFKISDPYSIDTNNFSTTAEDNTIGNDKSDSSPLLNDINNINPPILVNNIDVPLRSDSPTPGCSKSMFTPQISNSGIIKLKPGICKITENGILSENLSSIEDNNDTLEEDIPFYYITKNKEEQKNISKPVKSSNSKASIAPSCYKIENSPSKSEPSTSTAIPKFKINTIHSKLSKTEIENLKIISKEKANDSMHKISAEDTIVIPDDEPVIIPVFQNLVQPSNISKSHCDNIIKFQSNTVDNEISKKKENDFKIMKPPSLNPILPNPRILNPNFVEGTAKSLHYKIPEKPRALIGRRRNTTIDFRDQKMQNVVKKSQPRRSYDDTNNIPITFLNKTIELSIESSRQSEESKNKMLPPKDTVIITKLHSHTKVINDDIKIPLSTTITIEPITKSVKRKSIEISEVNNKSVEEPQIKKFKEDIPETSDSTTSPVAEIQLETQDVKINVEKDVDIITENKNLIIKTEDIPEKKSDLMSHSKDVIDALKKISSTTTIVKLNSRKSDQNDDSSNNSSTEKVTETSKLDNLEKENSKSNPPVVILSDDEDLVNTKKTNLSSNIDFIDTDCFLISNIKNLGKIPCVQLNNKVKFLMPKNVCIYMDNDIKEINKFIREYLTKHIFSMVPSHLEIKWEFSTNKDILNTFDIIDEETLDPHMVLTEYGLVDLRDNFETEEMMKKNDKIVTQLLLLKMAKIHLNIQTFTPKTGVAVIEKVRVFINKLKDREKDLENQKQKLKADIREKRKRLKELCGESTTTDESQTILIEDDD